MEKTQRYVLLVLFFITSLGFSQPSFSQEEYPRAVWKPAPCTNDGSKNCKISNRNKDNINYIVIHTTESTLQSAINTFQNPANRVSAHYTLGKKGEIIQHVLEKDIAYHAGTISGITNANSLGIEHEGMSNDPDWVTEIMRCESAKLTRHLADKYAIPLDRVHIVGHDEIKAKTDPGRYWDWDKYMELVRDPFPENIECNKIDLAFVIDATGSMADDIDEVKSSAIEIIDALKDKSSDARISLVTYRDFPPQGDFAAKTDLDFSAAQSEIDAAIQAVSVGGGGNIRETAYAGIMHALTRLSWREGTARTIILMGDAPPHDPEPVTNYTEEEVIAAANGVTIDDRLPPTAMLVELLQATSADPTIIHAILIENNPEAKESFLNLSEGTGGKLFQAGNAEEVVETILEVIDEVVDPDREPPGSENCQGSAPLTVSSVSTSDFQTPNTPENTFDNDLGTRWSAEGDGQWIAYDLGVEAAISQVRIAWHRGDVRTADFEIEVSLDAVSWIRVFKGQSSGMSLGFQNYSFEESRARYVRIIGFGNSENDWNSITEIAIHASGVNETNLVISSLTASDFQAPNVPENTLDNDLGTRWSAEGEGQWIRYDLGENRAISQVLIAWYEGDRRTARFDIEVSGDSENWTSVFSGRSSGTTVELQSYPLTDASARYVRIVGFGNSENAWNSIAEVAIKGCPSS